VKTQKSKVLLGHVSLVLVLVYVLLLNHFLELLTFKNNNMKNIHVIPTEQPSRLLKFANHFIFDKETEVVDKRNQHIYITSDEEIKEGDWVYFPISNEVLKIGNGSFEASLEIVKTNEDCKKIILTIDPTLIADGVQAIDDEFLEWFVKNPTCEFVNIELEARFPMYKTFKEDIDTPPFYGNLKRKMIIPQEESKQLPIKNLYESTLQERVSLGLDRELQRQKDNGKKFISDEEIDVIVDQVIKEELEKSKSLKTENIPEEEHSYLQGFIDQFDDGELGELDSNEWDALQFLEWLKLNNYEIIKKK